MSFPGYFGSVSIARPHPKTAIWLLAGYVLAIGSLYALV